VTRLALALTAVLAGFLLGSAERWRCSRSRQATPIADDLEDRSGRWSRPLFSQGGRQRRGFAGQPGSMAETGDGGQME